MIALHSRNESTELEKDGQRSLIRPVGEHETHQTADELERQASKDKQYSTFTKGQKRAIIISVALAAFFSPLTGSIYLPTITTIADALDTSATNINLTVTTFLVLQGVSPMVVAGFSDHVGRRPAYFLCFVIYVVADLALSLNNTYSGLLGLRMLQSAGSSGTIALANGVVADLVTSAERGEYIAFTSLASVLGPTLSPIIGGLLSQSLGWHSIFWFLVIFSVVFAVPFMLFLPETCRKVVDDGSIPPPILNSNLSDRRRHANRRREGIEPDPLVAQKVREEYRLRFPNPLPSLKILIDPETALILIPSALALSSLFAIQTGASSAFKNIYGFNDIQIALMFIPLGAGGMISAATTGKVVDWNFRRHAKRVGVQIKKGVRNDLTDFPVEMARLQILLTLFSVAISTVIGYGWMLQAGRVSLAGPVVMFLLFGYCIIAAFQALNVLLVDIWPGKAAASTAANSLVRCLLGAASSAAIEPMRQAMGYGWAYTTLGLIGLTIIPAFLFLMKNGITMRKKKAARAKRRRERRGGEQRPETATGSDVLEKSDTTLDRREDEKKGEVMSVSAM